MWDRTSRHGLDVHHYRSRGKGVRGRPIRASLESTEPVARRQARRLLPEACPRRDVVQSAADGELLQEDSAMLSESVPELPESIPTATACGDECPFESSLRVSEMLHPRRSWQIQWLSSSRFACNPSDGSLVEQYPCFRGPHGNNRDLILVQRYVRRCLDDLSRSRFVACARPHLDERRAGRIPLRRRVLPPFFSPTSSLVLPRDPLP